MVGKDKNSDHGKYQYNQKDTYIVSVIGIGTWF